METEDSRLERALRKAARAAGMTRGARAVIAVSGGSDSVALAALCRRVAGRLGWRVSWAHLHHGLRGAAADTDARFVRALARRWGVPFSMGRAHVARAARRRGESTEAAARRIRYRFLARVAQRRRAAFVLTAHTADDQAETVLLRLSRGAGPRGLRGILPSRPILEGSSIRLVRPLLGVRRAALRRHLARRGIPFREDLSNRDTRFARNRVRLQILAPWSARDPRIVPRLARLAEGASRLHARAAPAAARAAAAVWKAAWPPRLQVSALRRLSPPLRRLVLLRGLAARRRGACGRRLDGVSRRHVEALERFALAGARGRSLSFPGGIWRHEGDAVAWDDRAPAPPALTVPGPGLRRWGEWTVRVSLVAAPARRRAGPRRGTIETFLAAGRELFPLQVRARRPGDRFRPAGAPGSRKLGDYWTDRKFPPRLRDRWPLICRRGRLLAVPGFAVDAGRRPAPGAPAVRFVFSGSAAAEEAPGVPRQARRPRRR